jgi:uncharacterized protein YkwD
VKTKALILGSAVVLALCLACAVHPSAAHARSAPLHTQMLRAINNVRRAHDLHRVRESRKLLRAARSHSRDMIVHDYFAHTSPRGSTLNRRVVASGFPGGDAWQAGETLAWGCGSYASISHTIRAWMHSPEHRAILLAPSWRVIGAARRKAKRHHRYQGCAGASVWTADFGVRH